MILDSSAIVAVLCREPDCEELFEKIAGAALIQVSAVTLFESAMVIAGKLQQEGLTLVHEFLRDLDAEISPFTEHHASVAFTARLRYGNGRHPAALNFGDCCSYATAKLSSQPLLFVGNDFAQTDIVAS